MSRYFRFYSVETKRHLLRSEFGVAPLILLILFGRAECLGQVASPSTLDFGYVMEGSYVPKKVTINGTETAVEVDERPDSMDICRGYVVLRSSPTRNSDSIDLTISPLTSGSRTNLDGSVEISLVSPEMQIRVPVSTHVLGNVSLSPSYCNFGEVDAFDTVKRMLRVVGPAGFRLSVDQTNVPNGVDVNIVQSHVEPRAEFEVNATFNAEKLSGIDTIVRFSCDGLNNRNVTSLPVYFYGKTLPILRLQSETPLKLSPMTSSRLLLPRLLFRKAKNVHVVTVKSEVFGENYRTRIVQKADRGDVCMIEQNLEEQEFAIKPGGDVTDKLTFAFDDPTVDPLTIEIPYSIAEEASIRKQ